MQKWTADIEHRSKPNQCDVGGPVQVTAFGAIKANGETGTLPLGVNFQIGSNATTTKLGASAYTGEYSQVRPGCLSYCNSAVDLGVPY